MLERHPGNPILEPTQRWWEQRAAFNCAAVRRDGVTHLLYRAIGEDGLSRFGHATTRDGVTLDWRGEEPVFEGDGGDEFERLGCEDPRVTEMDGVFHVLYTAASVYPASEPKPAGCPGTPWRVRVALATTRDFRRFERRGVILPDLDSKNACLFPERVKGRYLLLHRVHPNMRIASTDDLAHWSDHGVLIEVRPGHWDSQRVGAGAPPIRTERGWLAIYHGVDEEQVYRLGALLLDLEDPRRVIARTQEPLLSPEEPWEREGLVPNVVFTCGAVEMDGAYWVYYGGADRAIGVARIEAARLMGALEGMP